MHDDGGSIYKYAAYWINSKFTDGKKNHIGPDLAGPRGKTNKRRGRWGWPHLVS